MRHCKLHHACSLKDILLGKAHSPALLLRASHFQPGQTIWGHTIRHALLLLLRPLSLFVAIWTRIRLDSFRIGSAGCEGAGGAGMHVSSLLIKMTRHETVVKS